MFALLPACGCVRAIIIVQETVISFNILLLLWPTMCSLIFEIFDSASFFAVNLQFLEQRHGLRYMYSAEEALHVLLFKSR